MAFVSRRPYGFDTLPVTAAISVLNAQLRRTGLTLLWCLGYVFMCAFAWGHEIKAMLRSILCDQDGDCSLIIARLVLCCPSNALPVTQLLTV